VTGFTTLASQLVPKQLGLLRELVPKAALVAFLVNPNSPDTPSVTSGRALKEGYVDLADVRPCINVSGL
jgi:hypothetical protein